MLILFDNALTRSTISSTYESGNYPADNLVDTFLRRRYQKTSASLDTIVCDFDSDEEANCLFLSYSDALDLTVRFYDAGGSVVRTDFISDILGTGSIVFTFPETTLSKIEIDVTGGVGTYIGGAGCGKAETIENLLASWEEPYIDNSLRASSLDGQSTAEYIRPLETYTWSFRAYTRNRVNEIKAIYRAVGVGAKVWVAPTEENLDFLGPFYGEIDASITAVKNLIYYDFNISIKEAR